MPTYEYQCRKCNYQFEKVQKMSEPALAVCPECGGQLQRLTGGGAAIVFKGKGFHVNDHSGSGRSCERQQPCCGRETPCDKKPCDE